VTSKRVLIVDDQRDIRQLLRYGLEALGLDINITDVPSGEEALLVISRHKFDLLVSDVRLAGMSGLELIHKVRQRNPGLRVILITGMTDSEVRQQVKEAGADHFFFKPVDMGELQAAVRLCLAMEAQPLPETPAKAVEPEAAPADPIQHLSQISRRLGGAEVFLVDASGRKISLLGSSQGVWAQELSWAGIRSAGAALLELVRRLPEQHSGFEGAVGYTVIEGKETSLHLVSVNAGLYLLVVTPTEARLQPRQAMEYLLKAAAELPTPGLQAFFDGLPLEREQLEDKPGVQGDLLALDSIFQQPDEKTPDVQALDSYWDELAEQGPAESSPDSGVISYDQARRLGLAPAVEET
jgi:DNA-binding response OmpR family regulator